MRYKVLCDVLQMQHMRAATKHAGLLEYGATRSCARVINHKVAPDQFRSCCITAKAWQMLLCNRSTQLCICVSASVNKIVAQHGAVLAYCTARLFAQFCAYVQADQFRPCICAEQDMSAAGQQMEQ